MIIESKLVERSETGRSVETDLFPGVSSLEPEIEADLSVHNQFLNADIACLFRGLSERWVMLFHSFGLSKCKKGVVSQLRFPDNLSRIVPFTVRGEAAVLGSDQASEDFLFKLFMGSDGDSRPLTATGSHVHAGKEVLLEYFERRVLSTLNSSWQQEEGSIFNYSGSEEAAGVEVQGTIRLFLESGGSSFEFWFGLGPKAVRAVCELWTQELNKKWLTRFGPALEGTQKLAVRIADISVKPSELIDYARSGSCISLELEGLDNLSLFFGPGLGKRSESFGHAELVKGDNSYFARVKDLESRATEQIPTETTVSLEIAEIELSSQELLELSQPGAIFSIGQKDSLSVNLMVAEEKVATGTLTTVDGKLAVSVL